MRMTYDCNKNEIKKDNSETFFDTSEEKEYSPIKDLQDKVEGLSAKLHTIELALEKLIATGYHGDNNEKTKQ